MAKNIPDDERKSLETPKKIIYDPTYNSIITPLTPHQKRSLKYREVPKENSLQGIKLKQAMAMDLDFQFKWRNFSELLPYRLTAMANDGCGLHMANLLRWYLSEFINRYETMGLDGLPSSFNSVEAFFKIFDSYLPFSLKKEIDHLVPLRRYFDWYKNNGSLKIPLLLSDIMEEGVIYSYNMISGSDRQLLRDESEFVIAGISIIRHEYELSCIMLCGEKVEMDLKQAFNESISQTHPRPGREHLLDTSKIRNEELDDSLLEGYDGFTKIIALARIDLRDSKFETRGIYVDMGRGFSVYSDDPEIWTGLVKDRSLLKNINDKLENYAGVFSALASLIYLPIFYQIDNVDIHLLEVYTKMGLKPASSEIKSAIKALGFNACIMKRSIICLPEILDELEVSPLEIEPPDLEISSTGFWKELSPNELGEGKNGEKVFGCTWVTRTDNYIASKPESFLIRRNSVIADGIDPGYIYVQRSASNELNLYKIGLTRRSVTERAKELSSGSGIALPFGVLAHWYVKDCKTIESEIHQKLHKFRVNQRREFFIADLALIIRTINEFTENERC